MLVGADRVLRWHYDYVRILPELMQLAAKVDEEIVLKKSSKEKEKPAKPDPSKKLRVSQPW